MENTDWTVRDKPFDVRERLFRFACMIVRLVTFLHTQGPVAASLSYQVMKAGTSADANYEEVDDDIWNIVYYRTLPGKIDERTRLITGV